MERYKQLVYSVCLREVENPELAEDATQVVFLLLAKKAATFRKGTVLASWLFRTALETCHSLRRHQLKHEKREQQVVDGLARSFHDKVDGFTWSEIEPVLNASLKSLSSEDQNAVLLRYFQNRSLKEVGTALNISEDAARMRIARALEKMRRHFRQHGLLLTAFSLPILLSDNASQAAASLGKMTALTAGIAAKHTAKASVLALLESVSRKMLLSQMKAALSVLLPVFVLGIGAVKVAHNSPARSVSPTRNQAFTNSSSTTTSMHEVQTATLEPLPTLLKKLPATQRPNKKIKAVIASKRQIQSEQSRPAQARVMEVAMNEKTRRKRLARSPLNSKNSGRIKRTRVVSRSSADIYPPTFRVPRADVISDTFPMPENIENVERPNRPTEADKNQHQHEGQEQNEDENEEGGKWKGLPPGIARKIRSGKLKNLPPGLAKKQFGDAFPVNEEDDGN